MTILSDVREKRKNNMKKLQLRVISDIDLEIIDDMFLAAKDGEMRLKKQMTKEVSLMVDEEFLDDDQSSIEYINNELSRFSQMKDLIGDVQILALYKSVEISIKEMLSSSGLFTKEELGDFYNVHKLKKIVKKKICDLENLPGYSNYDELRCIGNCIKHSGYVDDKLSRYPSWKEGEPIKASNMNYERLKYPVSDFVKNIKNEIIVKI